ncbi:hypothetical protein E2N92_05710 [Methanofollis formosanus]|uniref:Uncharacterized protein n=1 Tax=Methanofollis formosanus TaxID=299308 RepID=A0A8G1A1Z9_9EURY|nr:hypothetical protein [Methanofollis formosanus]QYZ78956.1 hypothetical protein E2N92_05710 [Methanofollis formosanus]
MKVRSINTDEYEGLAAFLATQVEADPADLWMRRFAMWWDENPAMDEEIPRGWTIEDDDREVAGFLGNIPVPFWVDGKEARARAASSWYVRSEVRGVLGLQLNIAYSRQKDADLFIRTTPNELVQAMLPRLGFSRVPFPVGGREYLSVRDYGGAAALYGASPGAGGTKRTLTSIARGPLSAVSPLLRKKNGVAPGSWEVCTGCGDEFAALWEAHRTPGTASVARDHETLEWLYFSETVADKRTVVACRDDEGALSGYCAFDLLTPYGAGVRVLLLRDAFLPDGSSARTAVAAGKALAEEKKAATVAFWPASPEMEEVLRAETTTSRPIDYSYFYRWGRTGPADLHPSTIDPDRGTL